MRVALAAVGLTLFFVLGSAVPALATPNYPPSTPAHTQQVVPAKDHAVKPKVAPKTAPSTSSLPRTGLTAGALALVGLGMVVGGAGIVRATRPRRHDVS